MLDYLLYILRWFTHPYFEFGAKSAQCKWLTFRNRNQMMDLCQDLGIDDIEKLKFEDNTLYISGKGVFYVIGGNMQFQESR